MPAQNFQVSQPQDLQINGLFLQFYLKAMEKAQDTLDKPEEEGLRAFNKHVYYLRSLISDDGRVKLIDAAMTKEKERLQGEEFGDFSENQKEFMVGFCVINGCMRYLDHTLNINKRRVKVPADQTDPRMPAPMSTDESELDE